MTQMMMPEKRLRKLAERKESREEVVKKGRSSKESGVVQTCREGKGNAWKPRENFILGRFSCFSEAEVEDAKGSQKTKTETQIEARPHRTGRAIR